MKNKVSEVTLSKQDADDEKITTYGDGWYDGFLEVIDLLNSDIDVSKYSDIELEKLKTTAKLKAQASFRLKKYYSKGWIDGFNHGRKEFKDESSYSEVCEDLSLLLSEEAEGKFVIDF